MKTREQERIAKLMWLPPSAILDGLDYERKMLEEVEHSQLNVFLHYMREMLKRYKDPVIFVYGETMTGKTFIINSIIDELKRGVVLDMLGETKWSERAVVVNYNAPAISDPISNPDSISSPNRHIREAIQKLQRTAARRQPLFVQYATNSLFKGKRAVPSLPFSLMSVAQVALVTHTHKNRFYAGVRHNFSDIKPLFDVTKEICTPDKNGFYRGCKALEVISSTHGKI